MTLRNRKQSRLSRLLLSALRFAVISVFLAVVFYAIFALLFSTPEEKRLSRENRMAARSYTDLRRKEKLLSDVVEGLIAKDDTIYVRLFGTDAPRTGETQGVAETIASVDTLGDQFFLSYSASRAENLMRLSESVDDNFRAIFDALVERPDTIPPLSLPIEDLNPVQVGASTGEKVNSIYNLRMTHDGIDLIAPQGTEVLAAASGTVSEVIRTRRGRGNSVTIDHGNGYSTTYSLLGDVLVLRGNKVAKGKKIGTVGISQMSYSPHLHYSVLKDGEPLDPVNHFFASVTPEDYEKMLYMSIITLQSMD